MKRNNGKKLEQTPLSATHRFFQKLGYKNDEQLRFVLVHDAKNNHYQRYSSNSNSAYSRMPVIPLYKPFHLIESQVPFITLYSNYGQPVHLFGQNARGYAIFMEVNYRESRQSDFQDIRAQFIDVDLNKVSAYLDTKQQAMKKAESLQASQSDTVTSVNITRTPSGRYLLLAERTRSRVEQLKKAYLNRHSKSLKNAMIVETKNGFHMYWPIQDGSIDKFVPIQKALVQKFSSDPRITNLSRAMRVPGFYHMKDPDDPFMVKVKQWGRSQPFSQNELVNALQLTIGSDAQRAQRSR
ncbi:DNA primase RepB-like protein [Paenibacillus cellulosilyticus]|uniref:DNA primase RepB-like protein n=1 Tax=Paenibacillus cellulosilyticus TaxID=375489 RepID=A0A2V2YVF7_9BACL|nr:DNA-primase RepB domain-containing protein [Paenibacillus cellulosilyticus]PWW04839.1 DNA primase RepB-like protein [Paenibacillus cellulosilyticus]QKS45953.1 hypothetical protein HUB94_17000 [Paenibacillus cellulosilyticus]